MRTQNLWVVTLLVTGVIFYSSCQKEARLDKLAGETLGKENSQVASSEKTEKATALYNLEVVLSGIGNSSGHIHFRQDKDAAKIIV